jgi:DNA repair protein RecO (recombination protein O)
MAETIYHGYLIKKSSFQTFDEIVIFLIATGQKIPCISMGSRKITSKNARNLFVGSYLEIQIFQSRSDEKLSKLKKVTTIKSLD